MYTIGVAFDLFTELTSPLNGETMYFQEEKQGNYYGLV